MGALGGRAAADAASFEAAVLSDVRIGFERTIEQDIGFGIRQQTDIACKALSPAVNDPYTAVQALDHLSVVYCDLAVRPLGTKVLTGPAGKGRVIVPGDTFNDYVSLHQCGVRTLRLERCHRHVGAASPVPKLRRGASHRFGPLSGIGSGRRQALADAEHSIPRPPIWSASAQPSRLYAARSTPAAS